MQFNKYVCTHVGLELFFEEGGLYLEILQSYDRLGEAVNELQEKTCK